MSKESKGTVQLGSSSSTTSIARESPSEPDGPIQSALKWMDTMPAVLAGIARTIGVGLAQALLGTFKGILKWWFRMPIKLFRPYAINPWWIFQELARQQGQSVSVPFMRHLISTQGWSFVWKNSIPVLAMNSMIGIMLFNSYSLTRTFLIWSYQLPIATASFLAGGFAGVFQSLLATPFEAFQASMARDRSLLEKHALKGIAHLTRQHFATAIPSSTYNAVLRMYKGVIINAVRDMIGFSLFFGMFESVRGAGMYLVDTHYEHTLSRKEDYHPSAYAFGKGLVWVTAGASAGIAFQAVSYPFDRYSQTKRSWYTHQAKPTLLTYYKVLRRVGPGPLYRGFSSQMIRVVPASALALIIYETASTSLEGTFADHQH